MRAEESGAMAENLFVGGGELGTLLRAHDWSQTPLGAVESWSDNLKTAVQILLTELDRAKPSEALKRSETTLHVLEEKYRNLFESIDQGFCVIEVLFDENSKPFDYRFLEINPAFEKQTGLINAQGKRMRELAPNHEEHWFEIYGNIALTGEPKRFESCAAALHCWYNVYAFRIGHPDERKVAILFNDITERVRIEDERKLVEATLRESEERFRELANDAPMFIWMADEQANVSYANQALLRFVGLENYHEFTGKVWERVVHPDEIEHIYEVYQTSVRDRQPYTLELRYRDAATGTFQWHLVQGIPRYVDTQFAGMIGVGVNIHDRKLAEQVAAADFNDMQRLHDLSTRLIFEDDVQVLFNEITAAAIAIMKADAGTIQLLDTQTNELILLSAQGLEQTLIDHFQCVSASSYTSCGIALINGVRTWVDFNEPGIHDLDMSIKIHRDAGLRSAQSTLLITRSGRKIGMLSTHWRDHHRPTERELRFLDLLTRQAADLIERRQTESALQAATAEAQRRAQEAEAANRIKDEFLAVLSHELRSPLNPILGWTQLLQNSKLDATRQREALNTIERNAKLQTQLIEDLLDISRIMQGKLSLTATSVSLTFVISAAVETVRLAAEAKNIQIILDLAPAVAPIHGDAARLQQVVWNLLTNAVKFTPNNGQVTIKLQQLDQLAQIQVIDTGKGINPQFLPYVFEYFRQEDGSTTRKFGGLGLGLAIVRQIVEMHGGTVRAQSQGEGQGATFIVQLPTMQQAASIVPKPIRFQTDAGLPLVGIQILLVDDEPDTREFQTFVLEQSGAGVTAVASGIEALQALEQSIPDVLVSDIGMAQMDGYMLLQQIRSRPSHQGGTIPAIALTAYATEMDQQRALQVGFRTHITKPVEPEELVRAVAVLLERGE